MPSNTANGIRLQWATIGILVAVIIQIIFGAMRFSRVESDLRHVSDTQAEIRFRLGNIEEGVGLIQRENTRFETKCEAYENRFDRLEGYHGVTNP